MRSGSERDSLSVSHSKQYRRNRVRVLRAGLPLELFEFIGQGTASSFIDDVITVHYLVNLPAILTVAVSEKNTFHGGHWVKSKFLIIRCLPPYKVNPIEKFGGGYESIGRSAPSSRPARAKHDERIKTLCRRIFGKRMNKPVLQQDFSILNQCLEKTFFFSVTEDPEIRSASCQPGQLFAQLMTGRALTTLED